MAAKNEHKKLKKIELLEILVSMSEENEALKKRNDQLETLLEERAVTPVSANVDVSGIINDIIECVQEVSVLFYKGSSLNESEDELPDFTKKVRDIYAQKVANYKPKELTETAEEITSYEDVSSGREEKEETDLSALYLSYSDYFDYLKKNEI